MAGQLLGTIFGYQKDMLDPSAAPRLVASGFQRHDITPHKFLVTMRNEKRSFGMTESKAVPGMVGKAVPEAMLLHAAFHRPIDICSPAARPELFLSLIQGCL